MKYSYKFSNLCGAVYRQGNVAFTRDGGSVLSPVGNRISHFDLKNNKARTYPFENRKNIYCFAVSPNGLLMITVDEDGQALLVNLHRDVILHHFNFKSRVYDIKFSPNGRYFAVTHQKKVHVWFTPGCHRQFSPFTLYRQYPGQYDDTRWIDWSDDSNFFAVGSKDMSCRVFSLKAIDEFHYVTLAGHRSTVLACFFEHQSLDLYTISRDGALIVWKSNRTLQEVQELVQQAARRREHSESKAMENDDDEKEEEEEQERDDESDGKEENELQETSFSDESGSEVEEEEENIDAGPPAKRQRSMNMIYWEKTAKHLFHQEWGHVTCAALHKPSHVLVVGFTSGVFGLFEVPEFNPIHTLSISQHRISSVAVNPTGEWLAFGCCSLGQLLVWEWQSETYILKQQSHFYDMNVMCYSPDSQLIATGGDDGKVKLWNTSTGLCFVTFAEHSAAVTSVVFNPAGKVVLSSSLDGTVRAHDLHRYRNFRTFASPSPVQFTSLAIDPSGELVAAGSHDTFEVFVWSMQTGRLLEVLAGHDGPVSGLCFSPSRSLLASSSWDKTVRVWDVLGGKAKYETFRHVADALSVVFRPDGKEFAVATLDGQISFWNLDRAVQVGSIEGRHDLQLGRKSDDRVTAKTLSNSAHFTSLCYSADGRILLAGGRSKFVCLYDIAHQILIKKFQTSRNRSFEGIQQLLNSAHMTEAGPLSLISDEDSDDSDRERSRAIKLPGVTKGDMSSRRTRPEIRTKCLQFSPTGHEWAAVTTEGLLIFSQNSGILFDPYDLSVEVTPSAIQDALLAQHYSSALVMSLKLNEENLVVQSLEAVPVDEVELLVAGLPLLYVEKLIPVIAKLLDNSAHLQFYLNWCRAFLSYHGSALKRRSSSIMSSLHDLQRSVVQKQTDLGKLCDHNSYALQYAIAIAGITPEGPSVDATDSD